MRSSAKTQFKGPSIFVRCYKWNVLMIVAGGTHIAPATLLGQSSTIDEVNVVVEHIPSSQANTVDEKVSRTIV